VAEYVTLEQMQHVTLDAVDVYLASLGGMVRLRQLTAPQVIFASRQAVETRPGTEGTQVVDLTRRKMYLVALALEKPEVGETDAQRIAFAETLLGYSELDQLLLDEVRERLSQGVLTAEDREVLRQPLPAGEMLEALGLRNTPGSVLAATPVDEREMILAVALRVPEVLFNQVPLDIVRALYQQILRERADEETAFRRMLGQALQSE